MIGDWPNLQTSKSTGYSVLPPIGKALALQTSLNGFARDKHASLFYKSVRKEEQQFNKIDTRSGTGRGSSADIWSCISRRSVLL